MPKRKSKPLSVHIWGIFDIQEKKLVKVSLDENEIDTDLVFMPDERYSMCEFDIVLET